MIDTNTLTYIITGLTGLAIIIFLVYVLVRIMFDNKALEEDKHLLKLQLATCTFKPSFNQDIEFLMYLIGSHMEGIKKYVLEPMKMKNALTFKDEVFMEVYEDCVFKIFEQISNDYKVILHRYFSEEGLWEFVSDLVFKELLKICLALQFQVSINSIIFVNNKENNDEEKKDK